MTDPTENCPGGLRLYNVDGVRACGRPNSGGGSYSVKYSSHGIKYTQICGRARGHQYTSPDGLSPTFDGGASSHNDINSFYVDGISLTRGSPRKHIWTFVAGLKEDNSHNGGAYTCPCQSGSKQSVQNFIGEDYYCESGDPAIPARQFLQKLYTADPLCRDGNDCNGLESDCCKSSLPWFSKKLDVATSDS